MNQQGAATMSGHPAPRNPGAGVWLEYGRDGGAAHQMMVSFPLEFCSKRTETGFWLEFSPPQGGLMGWMRFEFFTTLQGRSIFAAAEWRSAEVHTRPEGVWLAIAALRPAMTIYEVSPLCL